MESFQGKVAVVTGSASGIGRGMATVFAGAGMKIVLADIEEDALAKTVDAFRDDGVEVLGVWGGGGGIYGISKHAVTALSEGLYHDLRNRDAAIGTSLLLPALTATRINTAARNRPDKLKPASGDMDERVQNFMHEMEARYMRDGMQPVQVGEIVLESIREGRFYIFTHPGTQQYVEGRMRAILNNEPPDPGPVGRFQRGK